MVDQHLSQELIETCRAMNVSGINRGTSGNISVRTDRRFLITPSGIDYSLMQSKQIVSVALDGSYQGPWKPSSEWRMHADIYKARPDAGAVLHCHAPYATALSCLRQDLPAFHYMIAITGAKRIRCAEYALYGTQSLSTTMMEAFGESNTCLLANHGFTCFAQDLSAVLKLAIEIENLCQQYLLACSLGEPVLLTNDEMDAVLENFATYGQQDQA